ncbi:TIM barrel protein [Candidatus Woesearchaeota archaeon]|nr:TIM barrel protein [Candidatus Woesearchaeota archaeon]
MKFNDLIFGSPGIPSSTEAGQGRRDTANGIKQCRTLGLGAMEMEWVQSINVSKDKAPLIRKTAEENNIVLTCHGQYWVNLASLEPEKILATKKRMVDAATRMNEVNGYSITWHAAFYQGKSKEQAYDIVKKGFKDVMKTLKDSGMTNTWLRPETTGKETQWGDLKECIRLSQDVGGVLPCVDFAHLHARYNGTNNTTEEFRAILAEYEKGLGKEGLNNMHIQVTGIEYGPKGEKHHVNLKESDMRWKELLKVWKDFKLKGIVITESPNIEEDALLLQKAWKDL